MSSTGSIARCAAGCLARPTVWQLTRLATSAALGMCWGQAPRVLAVAPLLFAAFWRASSRAEALACIWLYGVVAARALVVGAVAYFDCSLLFAVGVVGAAAFLMAIPHALLWCGRNAPDGYVRRFGRAALMMLAVLLPPLGAFSVAHPIVAAGTWFPGWGVGGLVLLVALVAGMHTRRGTALALVVALCGLARRGTAESPGWLEGASMRHVLPRTHAYDFIAQWPVASNAMDRLYASRSPLVALPESVGGLWTETMQARWAPVAARLRERSQTGLVGATRGGIVMPLYASVEALGEHNGTYRQRIPMPIAMWRPGRGDFAPAWFGAGTLHLGAHRIGIFVCWEIGALWCVLRSVWEGADALVVVANLAWLRGSSASEAQQQALHAWARLFDLPAVWAANE